jgi:hypothetical protein
MTVSPLRTMRIVSRIAAGIVNVAVLTGRELVRLLDAKPVCSAGSTRVIGSRRPSIFDALVAP